PGLLRLPHRLTAALVCLALTAAGCSGSGPRRDSLRVGVQQITSLDPLAIAATDRGGSESLIVRQIFEGLVRYDPHTLRPRPALASSWRVSEDARTFTFDLRRARFHNGREV